MTSNIEQLERSVMQMLLDGEHHVLQVLRHQYAAASIKTRDFSGVGFFTHYSVPRHLHPVDPPHFTLDDVGVELQGVRHGAGVVLFVRDGYIDFLEGFTYDDPWPADPQIENLHYLVGSSAPSGLQPSSKRDISVLLKTLKSR